MKAVIQRVKEASVTVQGELISSIGKGLLVLLGVAQDDTEEKADYIVRKIAQMRIFEDENGLMNLSIEDIGGEIIIVSQFTLFADCHKGNRPSFIEAAKPDFANTMYEKVVEKMRARLGENRVGTGRFQTDMDVRLLNAGPVTIELDTP